MNVPRSKSVRHRSLESEVIRKLSCVVRRGVVGKVFTKTTRWRPTLLHVRFGEGSQETCSDTRLTPTLQPKGDACGRASPVFLCAEHVRQLRGESPLLNLMEVKS